MYRAKRPGNEVLVVDNKRNALISPEKGAFLVVSDGKSSGVQRLLSPTLDRTARVPSLLLYETLNSARLP